MQVVFEGENGRQLILRDPTGTDDDLSYSATLVLPDGQATAVVWEYRSGLAAFVREVAEAWRRFDGSKDYASIEGQLRLSCRHDGLGRVECRVTLGQPWPDDWSMEAVLMFGAGAHLDRLADELEAFFA